MTELISEVKLMRAALEEMSRGQTQVQALGLQIAAQQSRITQASASLDSTSAQLSDVATRAREVARELAANHVLVARTPDPNQRTVAQQRVSDLKQLLSDLTNEEAQLRSRISRLQATLTQEENRWQQLSTKLDGVMRR